MVMLMPPHFDNGLFNVFSPDIGCIASSFLICCPLAEPHYLLLVHKVQPRSTLGSNGVMMEEVKKRGKGSPKGEKRVSSGK
jgi:hypothetical protein